MAASNILVLIMFMHRHRLLYFVKTFVPLISASLTIIMLVPPESGHGEVAVMGAATGYAAVS